MAVSDGRVLSDIGVGWQHRMVGWCQMVLDGVPWCHMVLDWYLLIPWCPMVLDWYLLNTDRSKAFEDRSLSLGGS